MASSTSKMSLTNNMFSPALSKNIAQKAKSTVTARLSSTIKYYVPEGNMTRDQVLDLAFACAISATSTSENLLSWKNLIATYTNLLFEGIVTKLPKDQYQLVRLSTAEMNDLRQKFVAIDTRTDAVDEANVIGLGEGAFAEYAPLWDLPMPSADAIGGWGTYCRAEKSIYAHYAIMVFLAGKLIDDKNRSAITVARPKALIGKFKIEATDILNGGLRISDIGHSMLNQAWLEMSSLKAECFREFSTYSNSSTSLGQDIIMTNVNLMRFSQMNHASLIHKFLLAFPWASELGYLRQPIALFLDSLNTAAKIEAHLQPFIKVIWGDKSGLFPRKDLGPLIAVALDTEKEVHETLASYYSDEKFASTVEAFRDERERRETRVKAGSKVISTTADSEMGSDDEGRNTGDEAEEGIDAPVDDMEEDHDL